MSYLVDTEYAEFVSQHKWHMNNDGYLFANVGHAASRASIGMHRMVWKIAHGRDLPGGLELDHINSDPSDNRIANLRPATRRLNNLNRRRSVPGRSLPKGVKFVPKVSRIRPYQARIFDGKERHLGFFATPEEASIAYEKALAEAVASEAEKAMNIWQEAMSDE